MGIPPRSVLSSTTASSELAMRNGVHRNRTKASSHIAAANTGMRMMTLTDRVVTSGLQTTKSSTPGLISPSSPTARFSRPLWLV